MKKLFLLLLFIPLLHGCAKPIPHNSGDNVGILAIPLELKNEVGGNLIYYYTFTGKSTTTDESISIPVKKIQSDFAYSEPLPAGQYQLDTIVLRARVPMGMEASSNYQKYPFNSPVYFSIAKGKISLFDYKFMVVREATSTDEFTTSFDIKYLQANDRNNYREQLKTNGATKSWSLE